MKRNYGIATVLTIVAALVFTLMPGCGGGGGGGGSTAAVHAPSGGATFSFVMPGGSSARSASRDGAKIPDNTYMLSIMAINDNMEEPIEEYVSGDPGETVTLTLADIPVGETFFMINAHDSASQIIATAFEIVTIYDGEISTVYAELGIVTDGSVTMPQTFTLEAGETLNVKNISEVTNVPMTISGTTCPPTGLNMGLNGQLSCTMTTAGTYYLTSGGTTLATITVTTATDSSFVAANASADKGYGDPPLTVQFAGRGACGSCSGTYTYAWDFDDGSASATQSPSHTFSGVGDYVVTLTVTDSNGNTATDRVMIHVAELPAPEVASVSPATGSNDVDTSITVTGDEFQSGAVVYIGGTQAMDVTVVSSTSITATVPAGMAANVYDIIVENPDDQTGTLPAAFTVTGTSAGTYNAQDYFGLGAGDTWSFVQADVNVMIESGSIQTESVIGPETVNGVSCLMYGVDSSNYTCMTSDNTDGVVMYKTVDTEITGGTTVVKSVLFDPPITIVNGAFSLGDSLPYTTTATKTEGGVTETQTMTGSVSVLAVEDVVTPAGVFNDSVKLSMTRNFTDGTSETEYMWFAMGIGMVKDHETGCPDCGADGFVSILSSATVAGTAWPSALPAGTMDGQYWMADLGSATNLSYAWSGYFELTISGNTSTMTGVEGDFTGGAASATYDPGALTAYSNGTFTAANMTNGLGAISSSGLGVIADLGTSEVGLKIMAKKGASYDNTMIEGDFYAVTYTIGTDGVVSTEFSDVTILNSGTVTSTGYSTTSSGSTLQPTSNTESYTFNTTDGTFVITGDEGSYMGMVGENGDILLYVTYGLGDRELTYMVKKGSGIVANTVAGAFLNADLYVRTGVIGAGFTYMSIGVDGTSNMVSKESSGYWDIEQDSFTVDSAGRMYPAGDPDIFIGINREQNRAVISEQAVDSIGAGLVIRAQ